MIEIDLLAEQKREALEKLYFAWLFEHGCSGCCSWETYKNAGGCVRTRHCMPAL